MDSTRRNLLSFGFVREYCNEHKLEILPNDIVELFILWVSFCDKFDPDLTHTDFAVLTKKDGNYGEYQQIQIKS